MVARLKLKGIDGKAPPGVELANGLILIKGWDESMLSRHHTLLGVVGLDLLVM